MTNQPLGTLARTHTCGALTAADAGHDVVLLGWVHRVRDLGSLVFFDIRDRHGITQVVVRDNDGARRRRPSACAPSIVVAISRPRRSTRAGDGQPEDRDRRDRGRGAEIRLLNDAKTPPFPIDDEIAGVGGHAAAVPLPRPAPPAHAAEHRSLRHRATMEIRKYFDEQGFLEIETPMLTKSTPEGARDYLVPSRVHPGEFYALPQSPQIFKQILMIAGLDRYFQIAKCFRDEDLRADRQPEFTQVDLEISFATEELVFATIEPLMERLMALIGRDAPRPFRGMPYAEAIAKYGSDKPDLRCGMEIPDLSAAVRASRLSRVFRDAIDGGRRGARLRRPRRRRATRGASSTSSSSRRSSSARRACVWARARRRAPCRARRSRRPARTRIRAALELAQAGAGGPAADGRRARARRRRSCSASCGCTSRSSENLLDPNAFAFLWVVDFPMFEWVEEEKRYEFMHHPFTAPLESDAGPARDRSGRVRGRAPTTSSSTAAKSPAAASESTIRRCSG